MTGHCRQSRMQLETGSWKDYQANGDWVAILDSQDQLSLFNIESQKCLWSLTVADKENYNYKKLLVLRDGTVLYVALGLGEKYDLQIFQHGKKTGNIQIGRGFNLSSLRLVGDHILCTYDVYNDVSALYLWQKSGKLFKVIRPAYPHCFAQESWDLVTANDFFYVVTNWKDRASVFFIYNSNDHNGMAVRPLDKNLQVTRIELVDDKIICAAYRYRREKDYMGETLTGNAEILVLDANSGSLEKTFVSQQKFLGVKDIVANEHYIVYSVAAYRLAPEYYCIDRQTAETYPLPALSKHLRQDANIFNSMTLTHHTLTVHFYKLFHRTPLPLLLSCDVSRQANLQKPQGWLAYLGGFFSRHAEVEAIESKLVIREYKPSKESLFSNHRMILFYHTIGDRKKLHIEDYSAEPEEKVDETLSVRINRP